MSKATRNMLIVVAFILLIFGIMLAVYGNYKEEPMNINTNKENILDDVNNGLDHLINDIFDEENVIENTEKVDNNEQSVNTQSKDETPNNTSEIVDNQTTPGEKKAIDLTKAEWKKKWGSLDGISFSNVMIQSDGKYVVSVNDSKTTKVIRRYVVDTATGLVEEK